MKRLAIFAVVFVSASSFAQTYQPGYLKSDGTYVQGYYKSTPDSTRYNNLNSEHSIYGGTNPYTGKKGTQHDEMSSPPVYNKTSPLYSPYESLTPKKSCAWPSC